jgi:predicted PhzF superfamily epimerase YddE/YHI9
VKLPLYQIDAFTGEVFGGNPAAICPLDGWSSEGWPDDRLLKAIAAENNLSETAFFRPQGEGFGLRWFTPVAEVELCGHATLATAFLILNHLQPGRESVAFETLSGRLDVWRAGALLAMDFPSLPAVEKEPSPGLIEAVGSTPEAVLASEKKYLLIYKDEAAVRAIRPDFQRLATADRPGVIVTAPGRDCDFVSRFFAPALGVNEDPVTGSAHSTLTPYWAKRLGRSRLRAHQVSARGGVLECEDQGSRTTIKGRAVLYLEGTITIPA